MNSAQFNFKASNLAKSFYGKRIFKNISLEFKNKQVIGIAGENGSGKTTLLKVLSGYMLRDNGDLVFELNGQQVKEEEYFRHFSFSGPYLKLYEEFTPNEYLDIISGIRQEKLNKELNLLFEIFKLSSRSGDILKEFSSGMQQRIRLISAFAFNQEVFFLDEPSSNLDESGFEALRGIINKKTGEGYSFVIASNESRELELCHEIINLQEYNNVH